MQFFIIVFCHVTKKIWTIVSFLSLPVNQHGWDIFNLLFAFSRFVTGSEEVQTGPYVRFRRLWRNAEFCFKHFKVEFRGNIQQFRGQHLHKYTFSVKGLHFEKLYCHILCNFLGENCMSASISAFVSMPLMTNYKHTPNMEWLVKKLMCGTAKLLPL